MKSSRVHLFAVLAAYASWGVLPIYWKIFEGVAPADVVAQRAIWSFVTIALFLAVRGDLFSSAWRFFWNGGFRQALPSAVLIGTNWLVYLWAIASHKVLEASLGYFICPLISIALGSIVLGERCSKLHFASLGLIAFGVISQVFFAGTIPVTALALALSFSLYALYRKKNKLSVAEGMFGETALLSLPAVLYLAFWSPESAAGAGEISSLLLFASSGPITVIPGALFAWGLAKVSMRFVGIAQYLAPSLKLLVALFIFGESFPASSAIGYALVWSGIALYLLGDFFLQMFQTTAVRCEARAAAR